MEHEVYDHSETLFLVMKRMRMLFGYQEEVVGEHP